jgi:hypothetical protein
MSTDALSSVLQSLLRLPREQATVEFKSNWEMPSDIGQYISALANAAALQGHNRAPAPIWTPCCSPSCLMCCKTSKGRTK